MVQGIHDNQIGVRSIRVDLEAPLKIATQGDLEFLNSSITRGEALDQDGFVHAFLNKIWEGIQWFLSKVFFCFDLFGVSSTKRIAMLRHLISEAKAGKEKLQLLYSSNSSRNVIAKEWGGYFDRFPKKIQDSLIETYFIGLAEGKKLKGEEEFLKYCKGAFKNKQLYKLARSYFRDLECDRNKDPIIDMLKNSFNYIVGKFEKEIKEIENSESIKGSQ